MAVIKYTAQDLLDNPSVLQEFVNTVADSIADLELGGDGEGDTYTLEAEDGDGTVTLNLDAGTGDDSSVVIEGGSDISVNYANDKLTIAYTAGGDSGNFVEVDTTTGEITDGTNVFQYLYQYLHVRFSDSDNGANFVTDPADVTGSSLYIGLANRSTSTNLTNASDYSWSEYTWSGVHNVFYRMTGGNRIDFLTSTLASVGNAVLFADGDSPLDFNVLMLNSGNLVDAAITTTKIADDAITTPKITANAVTATEINVSTLSALAADVGDVTAGTLQGGTIPDADAAPSGTESGSFFDLTAGKFVVGDSEEYILFDGSTVSISGIPIDANDLISISALDGRIQSSVQEYTPGNDYSTNDITVDGLQFFKANKAITNAPATRSDDDWDAMSAVLTGGTGITITDTTVAVDTDTIADTEWVVDNFTYTAGNGLTLNGNDFRVDLTANSGLKFTSGELEVNLADTKPGITVETDGFRVDTDLIADTEWVKDQSYLTSVANSNITERITIGNIDTDDIADTDWVKLEIAANAPNGISEGTGITITTSGNVDTIAVTNPFTEADESKLDGIASGAEVNVQSDWNQSSSSSDDFIENKPFNTVGDGLEVSSNALRVDLDGTTITRGSAGISVTNPFTDDDETKLDGIETGATADQTAAEIKTAYESNSDTNAFTDTLQTKLNGIESGAEANQNAFSKFALAGDATVVADADTDTFTFVQGDNISLNTQSGSDSLTIAHGDTSNVNDLGTSGGTTGYIFRHLTFDTNGHTTGYEALEQNSNVDSDNSVTVVVSGSDYKLEINADSIYSDMIRAGSITTTHLTTDTLDADQITVGDAFVNNLFAEYAKIDQIEADRIDTTVLNADSIVTRTIESNDYVEDTSGWHIDTDGSAEFSNVNIRGSSTVDTTVIGGVAAIRLLEEQEDDTLNGEIVGSSSSGAGDTDVPLSLYKVDLVDGQAGDIDLSSLNYHINCRLTSGSNGSAKSDFDDTDITLTFSYQFVDDDDNNVGSAVSTSKTVAFEDLNLSITNGNLFDTITNANSPDVFPDLTATSDAYKLNISVSATTSGNWGLSRITSGGILSVLVEEKPTNTKAYIASDDGSDHALTVAGGNGLRIVPRLLFDGSAAVVTLTLAEFTRDRLLSVLVTWDDTNKDDESAALVYFPVDSRNVYRRYYPSGSDSSSSEIVSFTGARVGTLDFDDNGGSLTLFGTNQASNISNARIRRVYLKYF